MTDAKLFDALETCLQALEQGADVEACLALFPALADELRPILTAAIQARSSSVVEVPEAVMRRGKARVLQAAAEMREQGGRRPVFQPRGLQKSYSSGRFFRLAVTTVAVLIFLLTGGTGLVNASNSAIPGDRLYPVKRSWEGVRLLLVSNPEAKAKLEGEFDHERVQEIETLYNEKRIAQVDFQGVVQSQTDGVWVIGGLNIAVGSETRLNGVILTGANVRVLGETDDGRIKAEQIDLLDAPGLTPVPTLEPNPQPENTPTFEPSEPPELIQPEPGETPQPAEPTEKPENPIEIHPTEDKQIEPEPTKRESEQPKATEEKPVESKPTEAESEG